MKLLKKVYLIFLVGILLLCFLLFFFFGTDRGVHLIFRTVTDWISNFKIGSIHGNLVHGIILKNISYENKGISVRSSELYISVNLANFWNKYFCISSLFFKDCFIQIEFAKLYPLLLEVTESKKIPRFINHSVVFRNVIFNDICVKLDGIVISLDRCTTGFKLQKKHFTIFPTLFSGLKFLNSVDVINVNLPLIKECFLKKFIFSKESVSQIFNRIFSTCFFKKKQVEFIGIDYLIFEEIEGENLFSDQGNILVERFRMQGIVSKNIFDLFYLRLYDLMVK